MKFLFGWFDELNALVCGPVLPLLLTFCGVFLSFRTDFLQVRKFPFMLKNTVFALFDKKQKHEGGGITPFQAVSTAMAGTIGVGSIAGIASAIQFGGPGAVFWMWVSAFFGMIIKYSEILLSLCYREKNKNGDWIGGPMYYIKNGLNHKILPILFSIFGIFSSFGIGNMAQSNAISLSLEGTFGIEKRVSSFIVMLIVALVILGGVKRIGSVNEKLVPIMAILYLSFCILILYFNREKILPSFRLIFSEAFATRSAAGGIGAYGFASALRYGFSRGIFSTEAGLGSAPIAHAASNQKEPVKQAVWGFFEVFFTTVFISTLTALVLLGSDLWQNPALNGAALCTKVFDTAIPHFGGLFISISTILFAVSSILGWAYYGEVMIEFLIQKSKLGVFFFRIVFLIFTFLGGVIEMNLIWKFSETMNGLMAIPNLISLIGLSGVVVKRSKEFFELDLLAKKRKE